MALLITALQCHSLYILWSSVSHNWYLRHRILLFCWVINQIQGLLTLIWSNSFFSFSLVSVVWSFFVISWHVCNKREAVFLGRQSNMDGDVNIEQNIVSQSLKLDKVWLSSLVLPGRLFKLKVPKPCNVAVVCGTLLVPLFPKMLGNGTDKLRVWHPCKFRTKNAEITHWYEYLPSDLLAAWSPSRFAGKAVGKQSFQSVCEHHSSSIIMWDRADEGLCSSNRHTDRRCWSVHRLCPAWHVPPLFKRLSVLYRENLT